MVICIGHVLRTCPECTNDYLNERCKNYRPVRIIEYDVGLTPTDNKESKIEEIVNEKK